MAEGEESVSRLCEARLRMGEGDVQVMYVLMSKEPNTAAMSPI